jgi:16S rRNA (guanine966-N2)-methyltransferase
MRIGGGTANRRALRTVAGRRVRPTSGRVRQALCNMLRPRLADAVFVDLFAGTGSMGLEALSHGTPQAYFVERDPQALQVLQANIERCGMTARAAVISGTLPAVLSRLPAEVRAGIVFLDPPYASDLAERTLAELERLPLLAPDGVLVWQHAVRHLAPAHLLGLSLWQRRRYGDTCLSCYTRHDPHSHRAHGDPDCEGSDLWVSE